MHFFGRQIDTWITALVAGSVAIAIAAWAAPARAWDSGCGIQVHGAHSIGELNGGGPVGASSTSLQPGASALCDLVIGKAVVVGAFVGASKPFGDFKTLGINHGLEGGMRGGFLFGSGVLLYGHAAFEQIDVNGLGKVNGWKWGPGVEFVVPNTKWSMDARYQISNMDIGKWAPGVDAEIRSFRFGLTYKFGFGQQLESALPEPSDPKIPGPAPARKK